MAFFLPPDANLLHFFPNVCLFFPFYHTTTVLLEPYNSFWYNYSYRNCDVLAYVFPSIKEIARRRRLMGISQKALATGAGISQSLLAKIESGKANPAYATVNKLFEVLDGHEAANSKKASDVMVRNVVTLKDNDKIAKAAKLAKEHKISQFPVEKNGVYIGSIRSLDLLDAQKDEEVSSYINELPTVGEETPLNAVVGLLSATGLPVIVLSKGKVVGIITADDLFYKKV